MNHHSHIGLRLGITACCMAGSAAMAESADRYAHTIFALEHALVGVGFELEPVDGLMDPVTHRALIEYQTRQGLADQSGAVTDEALVSLGVKPAIVLEQKVLAETTVRSESGASRPNETIRIRPIDTEQTDVASHDDDKSGLSWIFF